MTLKTNDKRTITIYDIAKEAGVSPSTVSRVLTDRANVSKEKKQKVQELIKKYDFQPNTLAKGLANARTKTLGIMIADVRNSYYSNMFIACEQAAKEQGYTVILCNSLNNKAHEIELLKKLREQRVDAIIQIGGSSDDLVSSESYIDAVNQYAADIPFVTTGKLDGTAAYMVRIDDRSCMDILMNYLLDLNHQKIALIGGSMDVLSTFDKYQRYKQILRMNLMELDEELISKDGWYDYHTGYQEMKRMLESKANPTAVIAINETCAVGVIRCLQEHGYRVPEDVSVVSYDNTAIAELVTPRLTSVDYGYESLGKCLVDTAIGLLEGKKIERMQIFQPNLIVRESSAIASEEWNVEN